MPTADFESTFDVSPRALFDWHARPGALERLVPPWQDVRVVERTGDFCNLRVSLSVPIIGPLRRQWVAQHFDCEPGVRFRDRQVSGPFKSWIHTHSFRENGGDANSAPASVLHDHVEYELPLGGLGRALGGGKIARDLRRMFNFRHRRTRDDLARHAPFADRGPMRIAITGASGLLGTMLRPFLTVAGHTVFTLVRRNADASRNEIRWDPASGTIDAGALEGMDAVIHLAGENIADGRWTAARKARFARSRTDSTALLARTLARLTRKPRVLVSASATGFYGNRGDALLAEDAPPGPGFLPDLCQAWEAAAAPARDAGIRVVHPRIGVVLSARGGALAKLLPPTRLGLAGPLGTGRQFVSWTSSDDLLGILLQCLHDDRLTGPVNAVAPAPVPQAQLATTLARVLHRPAIVPLPAPAVRLAFGEMGQALLLEGSRVVPARLQAAGFRFLYPTLEEAIRWELGRMIER